MMNKATFTRSLLSAGFCTAILGMGVPAGCSSGNTGRAGTWLLTLDDGDLPLDKLIGREPERDPVTDTVTALRLPIPDADSDTAVDWSQVEAINSPDAALALAPGGDFAMVVSGIDKTPSATLLGISEDGIENLGTIDFKSAPQSASFHPDGDVVAVLCPESQELFVTSASQDGLGDPQSWRLDWFVQGDNAPSHVDWAPGGYLLAVTYSDAGEVVFFEFDKADGTYTLRPWGAPIKVGQHAERGVWSRNSRFYLSPVSLGFEELQGVSPHQISGEIVTIRLANGLNLNGDFKHKVVSRVSIPGRAKAISLSPNGRWLVAVSPRLDDRLVDDEDRIGGLLMLMRLDTLGGGAELVAQERTGWLSSAAAFDADGRHVYVTDMAASEVKVWWMNVGSSPGLEYTGLNVGSGRNPHAVVVVP